MNASASVCLSGFRAICFSVICFLAQSADACSIVYGEDWAFAMETPENWSVACGEQALQGTAITFWPSESLPNNAKSFLYVSVSKKIPSPLETFVLDEQARYGETGAVMKFVEQDLSGVKLRHSTKSFQLLSAPPARQELIAYIDGPTAYFMLVLTSTDSDELALRQHVFFSSLERFVAMKKTQQQRD